LTGMFFLIKKFRPRPVWPAVSAPCLFRVTATCLPPLQPFSRSLPEAGEDAVAHKGNIA